MLFRCSDTALIITCLRCLLCVAMSGALVGAIQPADLRPRLIVETDLGGDKDDQGSLVRLLMFSDQFEIEAILLDRADSAFQNDGLASNPSGAANALEMGRDYLSAWNAVRPNLIKHSARFPTYQHLYDNMIHAHNGTNAGRDRLIAIVDRDDPRPIWYGNWGSNSGTVSNLRRALDHVQATRSQAAYEQFASRLRIASLDSSGRTRQQHESVIKLHIETGFPDLSGRWYHRFEPITKNAGGFDYLRDLRANHGTLGSWYPGTKEGDSWCFVYLQSQAVGVGIPTRTTWGGWGGRYATRRTGTDFPNGAFWWNGNTDSWNGSTNRDNTAARFAADMQHHFAARMDWAMASSFSGANHPPVAVVNGDASGGVVRLFARPGQQVALSAAGSSDPDGDSLAFQWIRYDEADSYSGSVAISGATAQAATVTVPNNADGTEIHYYLEVSDQRDSTPANGRPSLKAYRRVVIVVRNQLKVMCLGDSITDGSHNNLYPGAYRIRLWELMQNAGWNVDLVGSKSNGPSTIDRNHEGYIGYRIDEMLGSGVNLASKLDTHRPDVVLLLIGTNDAIQNTDVANADHRYLRLLQAIQDRRPETLVIFGTLPRMNDSTINGRVNTINAQLGKVEVAAYHIGQWARLVNFNSLLGSGDLADGTHPNAAGYAKLAQGFFDAIAGVRTGGGGTPPTNQPPTVVLSAPANGATFTAPATIAMGATATDQDGSVAKVEFFQGGTKLGEDTAAPYTFTWSNVAAGTYTVTARVTDNLGAATTSTAVTVTVQPASSGGNPISGLATKFQVATFAVGSAVYTDRTFTVQSVLSYSGAQHIRTPNNDKNNTASSGYLAFTLTAAADVLVAYDSRATSLPSWLSGFTATGETVTTTDVPFRLYHKAYAVGSAVNLGGNQAAGAAGANSNYWLIVRPGSAPADSTPPVADAGSDVTVTDSDNNGSQAVTLDGSGSTDNVGIVAYEWRSGTMLLATQVAPVIVLPVGVHTLVLTVRDAAGNSGSDSVVVTVVAGPTEPPAAPLAINFQPATAPPVAGYLVDSGLTFATRNGQQYGWNQANNTTRDRNVSSDQRMDTLIHMQKSAGLVWELAVPNGTYEVHLACGDPAYTDQVNTLSIEGVIATDPDGQDLTDSYTVEVTVSDGRLTITPAAGAVNAKLMYLEVIPVVGGNG